MNYLNKITLSILTALSFLLIAGCSEDDNPVDQGDSPHLEANGVMLISNNDTLVTAATANDADVVGEIHVYEGEETADISVRFLNDEGEWISPDPEDQDHSMEIIIGNGDMIEAHVHDWEFHIGGLEEGETWIRVRVLHGDHADYLSPRLPVHVEHSEGHHGAPVGMRVKEGENVIVEADASNNVTGHLDVLAGDTTGLLEIYFFDENNIEFQPEADHHLSIEIMDTNTATVKTGTDIPNNTNVWVFTLTGLQTGTTNATFAPMHGDHSHYTSPAIEIHVE